jgi:aminoglycoside phosphotransferase (APT) family kinase protein
MTTPNSDFNQRFVSTLTEKLGGQFDALLRQNTRRDYQIYTAQWLTARETLPVVVHLFTNNGGLGGGSAENLRTEARALPDLVHAGYPVPELLHHSEGTTNFPVPFSVCELVGEQTLADLLRSADLGDDEWAHWNDSLVGLLVRLHTLHDQANFDWLQPALSPLDYAERHVNLWSRQAGRGQDSEAIAGLLWLRGRFHVARRAKSVGVVHRLFQPENILIAGERVLGVTGWCKTSLADPAVDVGWLHMLLCTQWGEAKGKSFIELYHKRNPNIAATIAFWEVYAAAKFLVNLAENNATPQSPHTREAVVAFMRARMSDGEDD